MPGADMLSFIAGWIGLKFESRWPIERRRRMLKAMARLLYLRGTAEGLRQAMIAYFGWREPAACEKRIVPCGCHPRCGLPPAPVSGQPMMILEHWRLRRWLFLGAGRLGDAAVLWGSGILDKVELDRGARVGASRLDSVHDSLRDPFFVTAWKFSLFLPARYGREAAERGAILRFVDQFRPATPRRGSFMWRRGCGSAFRPRSASTPSSPAIRPRQPGSARCGSAAAPSRRFLAATSPAVSAAIPFSVRPAFPVVRQTRVDHELSS